MVSIGGQQWDNVRARSGQGGQRHSGAFSACSPASAGAPGHSMNGPGTRGAVRHLPGRVRLRLVSSQPLLANIFFARLPFPVPTRNFLLSTPTFLTNPHFYNINPALNSRAPPSRDTLLTTQHPKKKVPFAFPSSYPRPHLGFPLPVPTQIGPSARLDPERSIVGRKKLPGLASVQPRVQKSRTSSWSAFAHLRSDIFFARSKQDNTPRLTRTKALFMYQHDHNSVLRHSPNKLRFFRIAERSCSPQISSDG